MPTFIFNDLQNKIDLDGTALQNLQCNIIRSVNRNRSRQVFRRFGSQEEMRKWLRTEAPSPSSVTAVTAPFVNVLFTRKGLELLGVAKATLESMDPAFYEGARDHDRLRGLGDDPAKLGEWEEHEHWWHAVELHAHNDIETGGGPSTGDCLIEHGAGIDEHGKPLTQGDTTSYGHFRMHDGISKFVYSTNDFNQLPPPNNGSSYKWDPRQKLSTLLVEDPLAPTASESFGSYFVFRKYKQDIQKFTTGLNAIATEIAARRANTNKLRELSPEDRGYAPFNGQTGQALIDAIKEWIFGRTWDGKVLGQPGNDFNFEDDADGRGCPFHGHIRKMNPRGESGDPAERSRGVARRGTSLVKTEVLVDGQTTARAENGLLFWCAQSNIATQFEHIQARWANGSGNDPSHAPMPDVDGVIGRLDPRLARQGGSGTSRWQRWKSTTEVDFNIWDAITLAGAEYCYAPSLAGFAELKRLAGA